MKLNDPRTIRGWCMYDWANSVYSLVITSAIFPVYYNAVTMTDSSDVVSFFGIRVVNTVLYSYALSFSFLVTAVVLPLLSGMADYSGKKKYFMKIFVTTGAVSCMGLFFFTGENVEWAIICSVLASIGFSGSLVFYDAFLPEIVTPDRFDKVSAQGYSWGYVGSVILLIINLLMIQFPAFFGIPESDSTLAPRLSFLLVGIWWLGFSMVTFSRLPDNVYNRQARGNLFTQGYIELNKVWKTLGGLRTLRTFLGSYFFYNMGVQTVMLLAASYGDKELGMDGMLLILIVLIIQLVGIAGALGFARLSSLKGNRFSLVVMIIIWIFICLAAFFVRTTTEFFILAFFVGLVMGGIQSLSRATYAKMIPPNSIDHASYFSFFDVTYYLSIVVGTFSYALIEQVTGSMRNSTLVLMIYFIIGLALLLTIRLPGPQRREVSA